MSATSKPTAPRDLVLAAAITFMERLTGMKAPPLEEAPPEVFAPFRVFADEVLELFPPPALAPWPDFAGRSIHHGDRLRHPADGSCFVAVQLQGHESQGDAWRAVYDDGTVLRLCLQIGDKGQAEVLAPRPAQLRPASREQLAELIRDNVAGVYQCLRVWAAWRAGTMSEDDFALFAEGDGPDELAALILAEFPLMGEQAGEGGA